MEFASVVVVAFVFGVASAPYGLALDLPPAVVALGVLLGSSGFVVVMVPTVLNLVPESAGRRARLAVVLAPRAARIWQRAGSRVAGARTAVAVDRTSAVLDRLGAPGVGLLAPVLGKWMVPAAGVVLGVDRRRLTAWAVLGCAAWSVSLTLAFELLLIAFR